MGRAMKDSGVEWIEKIPADWTVVRLKSLFTNGKGLPITKENLVTSGVPVISYGQIHAKFNTGVHIMPEILRYVPSDYLYSNPTSLVKYGDFIFADTSEDLAGCGNCAYVDIEATLFAGYHTIILRAKEIYENKYLAYLFLTDAWRSQIRSKVSGVKLFSISRKILMDTTIIQPPVKAQTQIVAYLDSICSKIDSAIGMARISIDEYKHLKQAVITQAVTKGVRGERPMKNSGIEWLKEIPSTWSAEKGKRLFVETNERSVDGSEELLTVSHITGVTPRSQKNVNMFMAETLTDYKICHKGDIAANTMWMWQGAIGVSKYYGVISPSYNTYRQSFGTYDSEYLDYLLRAKPLVGVYNAYSTGITLSRLRLYPEQFFSIIFPVPPMDEQKEIASYLDQKCAEIDALITQKEQLLTELENYKKSLIYEYVTGKKEVPS